MTHNPHPHPPSEQFMQSTLVPHIVALKDRGDTRAEALREIELECGRANCDFHPEAERAVQEIYKGTYVFAEGAEDAVVDEEFDEEVEDDEFDKEETDFEEDEEDEDAEVEDETDATADEGVEEDAPIKKSKK